MFFVGHKYIPPTWPWNYYGHEACTSTHDCLLLSRISQALIYEIPMIFFIVKSISIFFLRDICFYVRSPTPVNEITLYLFSENFDNVLLNFG